MSAWSERSTIKDNHIKDMLKIMQQREVTSIELAKKYGIDKAQITLYVRDLSKEIKFNKRRDSKRIIHYSINSPIDVDNLKYFNRTKVGERQTTVDIEDVNKKIESEIATKKSVCRTDLLDWFCRNFKGEQSIRMGELIKLVNSYGVKVVNV